jgi:hypothetical protein
VNGQAMKKQSKAAVAFTDQDLKTAKMIRESRWNFRGEYDANHAQSNSIAVSKNFQRRKNSRSTGIGGVLATGSIISGMNPSPVARRWKYRRTPSVIIAVVSPSAISQQIKVITERTETCLKLKRVCNGIWAKDEKLFNKLTGSPTQHKPGSGFML